MAVNPVFALAFDHRDSLRGSFMGLEGDATAEEHDRMVAAKGVVVDAVVAAASQVAVGTPALLVDAEYGGRFVATARSGGVRVAMPVEVSGQEELRYEYDGDFARIVEPYRPDYVKVLVRYNPEGDPAMNARQRDRLRHLAEWLADRPQRLMLELLVPPLPQQLADVDGERARFHAEVRAGLTVRAVDEIGADGVRPDLWKIEGPESLDDANAVAGAVRRVDPEAACLVLGRGADLDAVRRWLTTAAAADGFSGFAVGRTVWWDALKDFLAGADRSAVVAAIAERYLSLVDTYLSVG